MMDGDDLGVQTEGAGPGELLRHCDHFSLSQHFREGQDSLCSELKWICWRTELSFERGFIDARPTCSSFGQVFGPPRLINNIYLYEDMVIFPHPLPSRLSPVRIEYLVPPRVVPTRRRDCEHGFLGDNLCGNSSWFSTHGFRWRSSGQHHPFASYFWKSRRVRARFMNPRKMSFRSVLQKGRE